MQVQGRHWPLFKGRVYPICSARRDVLAFPTVVIAGENLPVIGLPPSVALGFQSKSRISSVSVKRDDLDDFFLESSGDRQFILTLPFNLIDQAAVADSLQRGLSAIAVQNRSNFSLVIMETAHRLNNLSARITNFLQLFDFLSEGSVSTETGGLSAAYKQCGDVFYQPESGLGAIDMPVAVATKALMSLMAWGKTAGLVLEALPQNEVLAQEQETFGLAIEAVNKLPQIISSTWGTLEDLGRLNVVKPMKVSDVILLNQTIRDLMPDNKTVGSQGIFGNQIMICQVFEEMIANARRAGGELRLTSEVLPNRRLLEFTLLNKVSEKRAQAFFRPGGDNPFDKIKDDDTHVKQRIFKRGITSRPVEEISSSRGGVGLANVWELVKLRLNGEIHADYNPVTEEFALSVAFRLADN